MKLIMGADVHASNSLPFAKATDHHPVYTDRLLDVKSVLEQAYDHATAFKAKAVVVLGDLFDVQKVDAPPIKMVADLVDERYAGDGTELWVADIEKDGSLSHTRRPAGGAAESIFQPQ